MVASTKESTFAFMALIYAIHMRALQENHSYIRPMFQAHVATSG
jgi:hypothetical protein